MHELAAAQDVLRVVLAAAQGEQARRVTAISLKLGRHYAVEQIESLFAALAGGTIAEGARLDIEAVPGLMLAVESLEVE